MTLGERYTGTERVGARRRRNRSGVVEKMLPELRLEFFER
jgi:hypothetical protein